ncbi:MAG: AMP-binding protein [Pseudomonadota bacterium]
MSSTFAKRLETFGDSIAIRTDEGATVSYSELAERSDAFARRLGGVRRLVLIEATNTLEPLIAYLGALRGDHPVILAAASSDNRRLVETFQPDAHFSKVDGSWQLRLDPSPPARLHPELAVLLSTSGTTGATKLVRLSASAIDANARSIIEYLGITTDDRAVTSLPFHYSYGLSVVNSHLMAGACLLLTDGSVVDAGFWSFLAEGEATSLAGVPYTYELLERIGFRAKIPRSLRTLTQAGGRLAPQLVTSLSEWASHNGLRFFVMYGQTEATARMAYLPPNIAAARPDAIGVPIPGGKFELLGEDGRLVAGADQSGELVYRGPNVMMGYAVKREDLARGADIGPLHTGDIAIRGADGIYKIVGRMSRFAKIFGLRISLDEVESRLRTLGHSGASASDDQAIYLAVLGEGDPEIIASHLSMAYKIPQAVFQISFCSDLPTLPSGKIDYQAILKSGKTNAPFPPAVPADQPIASAFARSFPRATVGPQDTFVTLGGDSLNYVSMSLELEQVLGFLPADWEQLTLAELAALTPRQGPQHWWSLRSIETEVVLRMLAILAVVVNHASDLVVGGGAEVLLILAGYNLSRYQASRLKIGESFTFVTSFMRRIILPYFLMLSLYLIAKRTFDFASLLMVSNFFGRYGSLIEPFWFLEVLLQSFLIVALLTQLKPVQLSISRNPWLFGLVFLGAAIAIKCAALALFHHEHLQNRTPDAALPLIALGWCAHNATTNHRRLLITLVILSFALLSLTGLSNLWFQYPYPSRISHAVWLSVCAVGLLWIRQVPLPTILHSVVASIAAASFYIYLAHVIPLWVIYWKLGVEDLAPNLVAAVSLGVGVWLLVERSTELRSRLSSRPT